MAEYTPGIWYLVYQTFDEDTFRETESETEALRAGFIRVQLQAQDAAEARIEAFRELSAIPVVVATDGNNYPASPKVVYAEDLQRDLPDLLEDDEDVEDFGPVLVDTITIQPVQGESLGALLKRSRIRPVDHRLDNDRIYVQYIPRGGSTAQRVFLFRFARNIRSHEVRDWMRANGYEPADIISLACVTHARAMLGEIGGGLLISLEKVPTLQTNEADAAWSFLRINRNEIGTEPDPNRIWPHNALFLATHRAGG